MTGLIKDEHVCLVRKKKGYIEVYIGEESSTSRITRQKVLCMSG